MSVRFGIVGTNWITDSFIETASKLDDFELTAVFSRTRGKAEQFANKYGVKHIYTDLDKMATSNLIDAVYIATPNAFHAEQSILFLENKKHVLTEKAFASNVGEAKEMIKAAKKNNVLLMEALKTTLLPNFHVIKENVSKIGTIRRVFASYCQYSSRYDAYKKGTVLNAFKPELSNGSLMDIGVYCIYPVVALFGKPHSIKASSYMLDSGVDGEGSIIMTYDTMDIIVIYSKITNSYLPSEIQGEEGTIVIDQINTPKNVKIYSRDGKIEDVSAAQIDESMYYEAKEFIELIQAGKLESAINTHATSLAVMEIMDEVRKQTGIIFSAD